MPTWTVDAPQRLSFEEPVTRLDVYLISGRLNVVGTDGPARVEIANAGTKPIIVAERDGHLTVRHERIPRWPSFLRWLLQFGRRVRVDVSIAVPVDARADLHLVEGSVIVSGLRRETFVDVTSGRITLMGLGGRTVAKLVSGPVEALGVAGDLTMETISGELILADSSAERVHARAVSGSITCDLDNPRRSEIRLGTTSGSVTVRVREDSDLSVHLHTMSGRITSAFPGLRSGGPSWTRDAQGVLGAGEGKLWASTTSGSIALLSRPAPDPQDAEPEDAAI
ncbi:DUF4097 family beta strand repeat-containing protein [Phytohabitans sp. ZYX-F-186]|uniref:DUF4097 family beta strand repeat-containing protein n=1 Tax=Phytohabitans maris TaxID=3071409 RepID=A0ABU0ZJP1_9ACTN|nr:DUF4097 family beta strand repeat-containing protein [Phytohabitans sp. ZYX-F-186]MDQ7907193.1 DUF4097 family beta strand repeat-containing protein [Phytohabitans sp. ZYX-F-186]